MLDDWQINLIIGGIVLLVIITIFTIVYLRKNKKTKEKNAFPGLLEALGGKENVENIELSGSRINLFLTNKKNIDKEKIKENGVSAIVVTSKKITLVIGKESALVFNYLKENLSVN